MSPWLLAVEAGQGASNLWTVPQQGPATTACQQQTDVQISESGMSSQVLHSRLARVGRPASYLLWSQWRGEERGRGQAPTSV